MKSIILVGMPGSGKSTLGRLLANEKGMAFSDTDQLIEGKADCNLQEYLNEHGYLELRDLEERVILKHRFTDTIVATGGSVVYSDKTMAHLKQFGTVVYLEVSEKELLKRIHNMDSRGIACKPGQSFHSLFIERNSLYLQHADITLSVNDESPFTSLKKLMAKL